MIFNQGEEINKDKRKKNVLIILVMVVLGVMIGIGAALYLSIVSYYGKENLKQAEECFVEERYEDALSYYEKAFHWDYSLTDAWLGAAECHIIMGEYEEAFDILEEGWEKLKNNNKYVESRRSLFEKQKEIFQRAIDVYLAEDNYQGAYAFVNQWYGQWKAADMRKKLMDVKTQVYLAEADSYLQGDDDAEAFRIIDEGIEDMDSVIGIFDAREVFIRKLRQKKLEAYLLWSKHHLSEEEYLSVKQMLEANEVTAWLERYLSEEERLSGMSIWEEKEAYLQKKVGYTRASVIRSDGTSEVREYNEKKVLTKETSYDSNGNITTWVEYGDMETENTIKNTWYNPDGSIKSWIIYENNEAGKPISYSYYESDGTYYGTHYGNKSCYGTWEYDEEGNAIKYLDHQSEGKILTIVECEYDLLGRRTQYIEYISGYSIRKNAWITYDYNGWTKPIKERYHDSEGNEIWRWENKYDKAENLISQEARDSQGQKLGHARYYEYDIFGNIIKFTEIEGDEEKTETYNYDYIYIGK